MKKKAVKAGKALNKKYIISAAFIALAVVGVAAGSALVKQDQNTKADASLSCRPALKQVLWRSDNEYYRYVFVDQATGKVTFGSTTAWRQNGENSPYKEVKVVSHSQDPLKRYLTKFLVMGSSSQTGIFMRPSITANVVEWGKGANIRPLDLTAYPKNMVALSTAFYGNNMVYKAITYENNVPKAYVRSVAKLPSGELDFGNAKFVANSLDHFPGSGPITAFNEEVYNGFLVQKLVRDNQIYVREVPFRADGQADFSPTKSQWKLAVSVQNSKWPGTGTVDGLSEYLDCAVIE